MNVDELELMRKRAVATIGAAIDDCDELAGIDVAIVDHLPDQVHVPAVLFGWADPWLSPSTLCDWEVRAELIVLAARLVPGGQLVRLEQIIATIVPALRAAGEFVVSDVSAPYPFDLSSVAYLAASINLTADMED